MDHSLGGIVLDVLDDSDDDHQQYDEGKSQFSVEFHPEISSFRLLSLWPNRFSRKNGYAAEKGINQLADYRFIALNYNFCQKKKKMKI